MSVLILVEHDNKQVKSATFNVIEAAKQLNKPIDALVVGHQVESVVETLKTYGALREIFIAEHASFTHLIAEHIVPVLVELAKNYTHILAPATTFGKNILPRLAALCDVAQISDVLSVESEDTFTRPIYAGNAIAKVKSQDSLKLLTIRTTAFGVAEPSSGAVKTSNITVKGENVGVEYVKAALSTSARPELTSAKVVISGGRGLQNSENFKMLEPLADKLNAAIGASRAAVDAGFVPNDYQVGQTGKIVAPDLYIAVGISGAIQHLAGMKGSKIIVAINKDPEAPIFQVADYGLVGDLFQVIPQLTEALDKI